MLKKWIGIFVPAFMFVLCQEVFSENFNEFERFIEEAKAQWKVPGVAVSIVQGDKVVFAKGFGVTRADSEEKIDPETIFQIASITKAFTSAALGVFVGQGKLGWDEEVNIHLPEFALKEPYPSRFATVRDLLAHRTGLPAFGGDLLGKLGYTPEEILYRIRFIEPATSFRNQANYSNVGYFIAGELLNRIASKPWEEVIFQSLLAPLKMNRSGFSSNLDRGNVAFAHILVNGQPKVVPWDRTGGFPAAGAVTSTASDMGNWMIMLLNGGSFQGKQVLRGETIQEMFQPSMVGEVTFSEAPPIDKNSFYNFGLGWDSYAYHGFVVVEKGGGLDGMRTDTTLIPELKIGITILSNLNLTLLPEAIRAKFLERYLGESKSDLQEEIRKKGKDLANIVLPEKPPKDALPPRHDLEQYTGKFSNTLYGPFHIFVKNNQLAIHAGPAHLEGTLSHWSNDTFLLHWPAVNSGYQKVTFTFGPENRAVLLQTESLGIFSLSEINF